MILKKSNLVLVVIGLIMIILSFIFLRGPELVKLKYFVVALCVVISILPFVLQVMSQSKKQKDLDLRFLEFVRDLVENVKSGTPISKAIVNLRNRNYGVLNDYVIKLSNQISLGITLNAALYNFARDTKSKVILRSVNLISEAERSGGEIETILGSVASSVSQTEDLKKEQKSAVYNLIVQGYIIFIIFIIIVLVLQFYILPLVSGITTDGIGDLAVNVDAKTTDFSSPLLILLLIQSFFAGIVIGKISEGEFKYGVKHSFILFTLALIVVTGANALFA